MCGACRVCSERGLALRERFRTGRQGVDTLQAKLNLPGCCRSTHAAPVNILYPPQKSHFEQSSIRGMNEAGGKPGGLRKGRFCADLRFPLQPQLPWESHHLFLTSFILLVQQQSWTTLSLLRGVVASSKYLRSRRCGERIEPAGSRIEIIRTLTRFSDLIPRDARPEADTASASPIDMPIHTLCQARLIPDSVFSSLDRGFVLSDVPPTKQTGSSGGSEKAGLQGRRRA